MSDAILALRDDRGKLQFPGVEFQENRLAIFEDLDADKLKDLIRFCISANSSSLFWLGDLLLYLRASKGLQWAEEVAAQSDSPQRLLDAMRVCEMMTKRFAVSFQHHREAYIETRNSAAAAEFLKQAEQEKWTVSELRRQIRQSGRQASITPADRGCVSITTDLATIRYKLRRLLKEKPVVDWSIDEIVAIRADLEPVFRFALEVERKWEEFSALEK